MTEQVARDSPQFVFNYLEEVEGLAEEILTDKQQIVDLDRKRNKNREGIRALSKMQPTPGKADKAWLCFGNMFIKLPRTDAKVLIEKDQTELDKEINDLRKNLKPKVNKLRDMEGHPDLKGFDLQALSKEELNTFNY
ncbi:p53 and DNA damage-regulated protein 1-like [Glandiceps talaboti]